VGPCAVCGAVFKLTIAGALRKHGHGHGHPPCPGSGRPPPHSSIFAPNDTSGDLFDVSLSSAPPTPDFSYNLPPRVSIKRIPAGARQRASALFELRLREVIAFPEERHSWRDLLQFGGCLAQPVRGGARRNFTSLILGQIDRVENGLAPHPISARGGEAGQARRSGHRARQLDDIDKAAAHRASVKLEAGDVRGAVRHLCSDESLAPPDATTLRLLRDKHPPRPLDRRPAPALSAVPMAVTGDDIRKAIRGFTPGSAGGWDGLRPQHLADMTDDG
jgi:hypothetical protein